MQQVIDIERYDVLQEAFVREIIQQIRLKLMEAGIGGEQLIDLTGNIAFSVASTIDGNAVIDNDGMDVHPYLVFSGDEDEIIHCGENSYVHEFVADVMNKVFAK